MTGPQPLPAILAVAPYKAGEATLPGVAAPLKLSSNENPLGAGEAARAAYADALGSLHIYPDSGARALRAAIGARYGLDPERIACGAGSDELFYLLGRIFLSPGDECVQSEHGFAVYSIVAQLSGALMRIAKDKDLTVDIDAVLAEVSPRTKIVWIANPNNPTGTMVPIAEVRRLHAALPKDVLLVLDAAYAEYVRRNDYEAGIELVAENDNVIMTRTFSKIHGLAALRVGWAYAPAAIVEAINKTRGPFNVPGPAQAAAIAAIGDTAFVQRSQELNARELVRLRDGLRAHGFIVGESEANFVLVQFASIEERKAADAHLRAAGVIVRALDSYGLPQALRITVGVEAQNDRVLAALADFKRA